MKNSDIAISFEPDGYQLGTERLMGRQVAGYNFLRAAVNASEGKTLCACTPHRQSAEIFSQLVKSFNPDATSDWLRPGQHDRLSSIGTLYLPDPSMSDAAYLRLRAGVSSYSLTGITHTLSSHVAMDAIADLATAPVFPWDALICTSSSVQQTVNNILSAQHDYLQWRFGAIRYTSPQLPVIPLGVHTGDFSFGFEDRHRARQAMGIADDEIAVLYAGRLSPQDKAHPYPMYLGLERAAHKSGKKIVLIQSGWFPGEATEKAMRSGTSQFCPSVRSLFANGLNPEEHKSTWAAADLFISLSDNIQETFGLTPVEAMAAGIPVIVTDWDGYRDTIRDGIDGFCIPTCMPPPGSGATLAQAYESGERTHRSYVGSVSQTVSIDHDALVRSLITLLNDGDLRTRMGQAGRARARATYDWSVIFAQYRDLWANLADIRNAHQSSAHPAASPARQDPYTLFASYPTAIVTLATMVTLPETSLPYDYAVISAHPLFSYAAEILPSPDAVAILIAHLKARPASVGDLATLLRQSPGHAIRSLSILAKMGLVSLRA